MHYFVRLFTYQFYYYILIIYILISIINDLELAEAFLNLFLEIILPRLFTASKKSLKQMISELKL